MNQIYKNSYIIRHLIVILALFFVWTPRVGQADSLSEKLKGRIVLQVEKNGEAWYIDPVSLFRYYLGRPTDAFSIMCELGVGISNSDLALLPIGLFKADLNDRDGDGISDEQEKAIGTNMFEYDSDGDGFSDYDEVIGAYNPVGPGNLRADKKLGDRLKGRIVLQVEKNGEAWYLDPVSAKRYFLGRPIDAFTIMRRLGLGISNLDLNNITAITKSHEFDLLEKAIFDKVNQERVLRGPEALTWNEALSQVAREHSQDLADENLAFTGMGYACDFPVIHHEGLKFGNYNGERLKNRNLFYFSQTGENIALVSTARIKVSYEEGNNAGKELAECSKIRSEMDTAFRSAIDADISTDSKLAIVRKEIESRTDRFKETSEMKIDSISWVSSDQIADDIVKGWMLSDGHRKNILDGEYGESGLGVAYVNGYYIATQIFIKRAECGYESGPCCEREGYYPSCFIPWSCHNDVCL